MSNISSYSALLKRVYKDGVVSQINAEVMLYDFFDKSTHEWNGQQLHIAVWTARSDTAANIADGGALPVAGDPTDRNLIVEAKTLADRVQVSEKLTKAAPAKGAGAFLSYMDGRVNRLIENVKNKADALMFSGGKAKGLVNEHKASGNTGGAFVGGGASNGNSTTWEYSGDFSPFLSVVTANTDSWVRIELRRMDTYAQATTTLGGGGAVVALFVSAFDQTAGTIQITVVSDVAGTSFTTLDVTAGFGIAVLLHATQLQDGVPADFGTIVSFSLEQHGILDNLCNPTHFQVDRTSASGDSALQSVIFTQATTGAHARAALTVPRMFAVLDEILNKSGKEPILYVCNPTFRSRYVNLLTANLQTQTEKAGKGDAGFTALEFNGKALKTSRHCGRGMIMFLSPDSWEVAEYDKGGWMELDGSMFSRVSNTAAYEATYTWDWELVCSQPNCNGILTGVLLA